MTDESEKRFHSIMDKLFHAPKSIPNSASSSSSDFQMSRGKKRANPSSALALVEPNSSSNVIQVRPALSEAPLCRPWDRGDLMRRLATFKSMIWFAKPEVVSALNCARRGWVCVDMDTIACDACGGRIYFSAPSTWSHEQVEKAALVFSLKLEKGHKFLCPWIDNSCDEMLAQFPPTLPPVLVDKFNERCSALLQLSALPVISCNAIEYMRSPQLEQIIGQTLILECGNGSADVSSVEYFGNERDDSNKLYYQAQKLISLCGWEPRLLPYVVDTGNRSSQSLMKTNATSSPHLVANGLNLGNVHADRIDKLREANETSETSSVQQSDPNSVVLDCKLCGASVGLWAFSTISRPLELLRLVGYEELNGGMDSGTENNPVGRGPTLNLTIAGGPPPTKQNFKATISLPVIGRNLRARFSCDSEFGDHVVSTQEKGDAPSRKDDSHTSCEGIDVSGQGIPSEAGLNNFEKGSLIDSTQQDTCRENMMLENIGDGRLDNSPTGHGKHIKLTSDKAMEFDPIKQHRHFCPWISSSGKGAPGWQQTLSALQGQGSSSPSSRNSPSASIIKVDDPITSVRMLFMSPSPKRMKRSHLPSPSSQN
ncbi:hypothetical protein UlMin_008466 [Ulmus minor]